MGYRGYGEILRRSWVLIVVLGVIGGAVGWVASALVERKYASRSVIWVSTQTGASANELSLGSTFALNRVETYASLAYQPAVLDQVVAELALDVDPNELSTAITSEPQPGTTMIDIDVLWGDADEGARIANSIAGNLAAMVEQVEGVGPDVASPVRMDQVRLATPAGTPASPDVRLFVLIGALIGIVIGVAVGALRVITDTRLRSVADVEAITAVPIIGTIPNPRRGEDAALLIGSSPRSVRAEAYRVARTNLRFLEIRDRRSFVVTSARPGEGKTTTASNLALSIAAADVRVALVDADLRAPSVGKAFDIEDAVGLSDVLIGRASLADVAQPVGDSGLVLVPAGAIPPNPSELLASARMQSLAAELEQTYDLVIFDSPPLLTVTDAALLSAFAVPLLVVSAKRSRAPELTKALEALRKVGSPAGGIIVSQVTVSESGAARDGRYGQYAPPTDDERGSSPTFSGEEEREVAEAFATEEDDDVFDEGGHAYLKHDYRRTRGGSAR